VSIAAAFLEHLQVMRTAQERLPAALEQLVAYGARCLKGGGKILACGNGGSACDAQHLVAELVGRFRDERPALPALTLLGDAATLTALANDYGYERVFARQVEALGVAGDLLIALSTSGNSANVVAAAQAARSRGLFVGGLTGADGGRLAGHCHVLLSAPSTVVARIQEVHGLCIHAFVEDLERHLAPAGAG
jgi:D-sedoheptulose 7-phosphate isomerase